MVSIDAAKHTIIAMEMQIATSTQVCEFASSRFYLIMTFLEYLVPYLWKCYRGKPLCAIGKLNNPKIFK